MQGRGLVHGIAVLKNASFLHAQVARLLAAGGYPVYNNYFLHTEFHEGGYAKTTPRLLSFCSDFEALTGIVLDPIYSGKMAFGVSQLSRLGYFRNSDRVVMVHTGGLQGMRGMSPTGNKPA